MRLFSILLGILITTAAPLVAAPASRSIPAGQTLTLSEDLVLGGSDTLEIAGTADSPCVIIGNRHQIRTADNWTGSMKIVHCRISQLGTDAFRPEFPAIDVHATGEAAVTLEHCTFDQSAGVAIVNNGNSTAAFRHNIVLENSVVPVKKDLGNSRESFYARGNSPARKYFQGNQIYRAHVVFESGNWLVGGEQADDSNILIGLRVKIIARGDTSVIRGNYLHVLMPRNDEYPYWSQVSTVDPGGNLLEQNVIRDGEWIVQIFDGEIRDNVICDINDHNLMRNGSAGRVHHNIFHVGKPDHPPGSMFSCIAVIYPPKHPGDGIEIYNNIFDGCGTFPCPGVEVCDKGFVKSLRNNVFCNFALPEKYYKLPSAFVRPAWAETQPASIDRLGNAGHNLFFNPASRTHRHYTLTVVGSAAGLDSVGRHDIPVGDGTDAEPDPMFKGPLFKEFPFKDEDIRSEKVTVFQMLAHFRDVYSPVFGSPLLNAGDPADGPGTPIGVVGGGEKNSSK